jgi:hypothetical protein
VCRSIFRHFFPALLQASHNSRVAALKIYRPSVILRGLENSTGIDKIVLHLRNRVVRFPKAFDWFPNLLETTIAFGHGIQESLLYNKTWDIAEKVTESFAYVYQKSGRVDETVVIWTALIEHYRQWGLLDEAISCVQRLHHLVHIIDEAVVVVMWTELKEDCRQKGHQKRAEHCARWLTGLYQKSGRNDEAALMWKRDFGIEPSVLRVERMPFLTTSVRTLESSQ